MLRMFGLFRSSFWLKIGLGAMLVALADAFFFMRLPGSTVGVFAAVLVSVIVALRPGLLNDRRGLLAVMAAAMLALVLIDRPGVLAWGLFGLALTVGVLSARVSADETAWGWAQRLGIGAVFALLGPLIDLLKVSRLRRRVGGLSVLALTGRLAMPVVGGVIFVALFAAANPLISNAIAALSLPPLSIEGMVRGLFWLTVFIGVLGMLRPRWHSKVLRLPTRKVGKPAPALTTSITWSLVVFNAIFALQNGLDIAFLWSGAPLPGDMGLADYAHRGAYPLIVTALLAGLFVLVALQPGSDTARRPTVRRLVVVWIGQNMLLVASSMLRTADYALTRFRIAAMVWMALVGVGLLLICWRMLRDKSAHWLINANVAVALLVLTVASALDLGALAAGWNIRHAREVGGRGVELDLGYLHTLGEPALVSLVTLEQTTGDPKLRDCVAAVRRDILRQVRREQKEWRGWTWRSARRLDRVEALSRARPLAHPEPGARTWDGRLQPPAPPPEPSATPSTGPGPALLLSAPLTSLAGD